VNGSNDVERHVQHGQVIGHEEGVELAALQRLREAFDVREVEIRVREGTGIAPGTGVDGRRPHECAQPELTRRRHENLLCGSRTYSNAIGI